MQRLGLLPTHMLGRFEPYRLITRSEAAYILHQALALEEITGTVQEAAAGSREFTSAWVTAKRNLSSACWGNPVCGAGQSDPGHSQ